MIHYQVGDSVKCLLCERSKSWGVYDSATGAAVCKDCQNAVQKQRDLEERESAICPEDMGFEEYIAVLEKKITELRAAADASDQGGL